MRFVRFAAVAALAIVMAGCGSSDDRSRSSITAVALETDAEGAKTVGVNAYLWRASLDTVSFMPLASADPYGGVIITDWYSPTKSNSERFKLTIYILDQRLRADAVKVSMFRQTLGSGKGWQDAAASAESGIKIENAILVRARQLRLQASGD